MADSNSSKIESVNHLEERVLPSDHEHVDMGPTAHEKIDVTEQVEKDLTQALEHHDDLDEAQVKKLIRKIDWRILPGLAICYAVGLIDKVNLGIARVSGMDGDLGLSIGNRYTIVSEVLFVPLIVSDLLGNLGMQKVGPVLWISGATFAWGIVTLGTGFVNSWGALLACRILFGALEGALVPGCLLILSFWYTRYEVQKRFAGFYCLGMLANGASNILAYALQLLKGKAGLNGWRWIFIIEGIASVVIAVMGFCLLVDFPDKATKRGLFLKKPFLSNHEAAIILARVQRDRGDALREKLTWRNQFKHLKDWKVWEMGFLLLLNNIVAYAFVFFIPTILLNGLHFSLVLVYVLSFPPYVLAAIWMFVAAWVADKYHVRGPIIIFNAIFTIIGVSLCGFATGNVTRYAGVFIGIAALNANIPSIYSYQHNNTIGTAKRAITTGVLVTGGSMGGIIASNVFRQQDAPSYLPGLECVIVSQALTVLLIAKNFWFYHRQNTRADRGEIIIEEHEGFRYTY